ncbi:hypothetical protein ACLUWF_06295 [Limosilactobacillus mucosae]|uniref:hypothetical protein n=1 Tax=Limosilactobacillus mucosae TaxID=97478 RepID=UPI00065272DA|nr:hypothetical protein [Limosilactobacillus mucosae]
MKIEDAKFLIRRMKNISERNYVMDYNYDLVGILSGHDIIRQNATINILNPEVIEWLNSSK